MTGTRITQKRSDWAPINVNGYSLIPQVTFDKNNQGDRIAVVKKNEDGKIVYAVPGGGSYVPA